MVWLVDLVLSQVLRDTRQPSGATLMAAILVALTGALLICFRGSLPVELRRATRALSDDLYPLLGGLVGLRTHALIYALCAGRHCGVDMAKMPSGSMPREKCRGRGDRSLRPQKLGLRPIPMSRDRLSPL